MKHAFRTTFKATLAWFSLAGSTVIVTPVAAQNFPSKPIRIIVPAVAGSNPDFRARQTVPKLAEAFGQSVIVDNRPGANGTIATQLGARAQPDGYTLRMWL